MSTVPGYLTKIIKKYSKPNLFIDKNEIIKDVLEVETKLLTIGENAVNRGPFHALKKFIEDGSLQYVPIHILLATFLVDFLNMNESTNLFESYLKSRLASERVSFTISNRLRWNSYRLYQLSHWPVEAILNASAAFSSLRLILTENLIRANDSQFKRLISSSYLSFAPHYVDYDIINSITESKLKLLFPALTSISDTLILLTHRLCSRDYYLKYVKQAGTNEKDMLSALSGVPLELQAVILRKYHDIMGDEVIIQILNNISNIRHHGSFPYGEVARVLTDTRFIERCKKLKIPASTVALFVASPLFDVNDRFFSTALKNYLSRKRTIVRPYRHVYLPDELVSRLSVKQLVNLVERGEFSFNKNLAKSRLIAYAIALPDRTTELKRLEDLFF